VNKHIIAFEADLERKARIAFRILLRGLIDRVANRNRLLAFWNRKRTGAADSNAVHGILRLARLPRRLLLYRNRSMLDVAKLNFHGLGILLFAQCGRTAVDRIETTPCSSLQQKKKPLVSKKNGWQIRARSR